MSPAKLGKGTRNSAEAVPNKARQALLISTYRGAVKVYDLTERTD